MLVPDESSAVVGWPKAYDTRYCACGLCGTMWNVIRVVSLDMLLMEEGWKRGGQNPFLLGY